MPRCTVLLTLPFFFYKFHYILWWKKLLMHINVWWHMHTLVFMHSSFNDKDISSFKMYLMSSAITYSVMLTYIRTVCLKLVWLTFFAWVWTCVQFFLYLILNQIFMIYSTVLEIHNVQITTAILSKKYKSWDKWNSYLI